FTLYLLHPIFLKMVLNWLGLSTWHLGDNGDAMRLLVLASIVVLIPVAYLSLVLFERPARDWIGRLGSERKTLSQRERVQERPSTHPGSSAIDPSSPYRA
ncbi:MAG: hypothetical protein H7236_03525, partial [Gemmatimonadaceae bacterium]|nr:hypothetical protein [Caulobacter sp.]